jgi:hypothetical protein
MPAAFSLDLIQRLGVALAIGFLVGVERGWRHRDAAEVCLAWALLAPWLRFSYPVLGCLLTAHVIGKPQLKQRFAAGGGFKQFQRTTVADASLHRWKHAEETRLVGRSGLIQAHAGLFIDNAHCERLTESAHRGGEIVAAGETTDRAGGGVDLDPNINVLAERSAGDLLDLPAPGQFCRQFALLTTGRDNQC